MADNNGIGLLLKKYRENCGFTQQQVANVLNIDRSTYTYYETGNTVPSAPMIIKISRIFNVPYTTFMDGFIDSCDKVADPKTEEDILTEITAGRENIYNLSKEEQQLVCFYRVLTSSQKNELFDLARKLSPKKARKP